jgi:hypothetical protein
MRSITIPIIRIPPGAKVFYSWFGFDQNLLSVSHCLLHIGMLFNDTEAMDIGMRNFEWSMGFNPLGGSFAPGLGNESDRPDVQPVRKT